MLAVHVFVRVKPGCEEAFERASIENSRDSVREPGCARFDVLRDQSGGGKFVLVEVYRDAAAAAAHKETAHYSAWRDTVADMMAEPRSPVKFDTVFPEDSAW